jgi:hypothetical protein
MVRRWRLIGYFPTYITPYCDQLGRGPGLLRMSTMNPSTPAASPGSGISIRFLKIQQAFQKGPYNPQAGAPPWRMAASNARRASEVK